MFTNCERIRISQEICMVNSSLRVKNVRIVTNTISGEFYVKGMEIALRAINIYKEAFQTLTKVTVWFLRESHKK